MSHDDHHPIYGGLASALSTSSSVNKRDGSDSAAPDTSTTYSYAIWDDARISGTSYNNGQGATHTSTYYYDGLGRLASVQIADGQARTVSFASNPNGQVLSWIEKSAPPRTRRTSIISSTASRSASSAPTAATIRRG